jgi:hypothetical protein
LGYEVIWEAHGVIKRLFGNVSSGDLVMASSAIQYDSRFDDVKYKIIDLLDCTGHSLTDPTLFEVSAIDVAAFSKRRGSDTKEVKVAIVTSNPVLVDLATHMTKNSLHVSVDLFNSMEAARAWLGAS